MSPNVGNFVHDLVEMAKAMETLPQVEAALRESEQHNRQLTETVQSREEAILRYKAEIEALHAKVRETEASRDNAETMFLELDEKSAKVVSFLGQIQGLAVQADLLLNPPKPVPMPEPVVDKPAEAMAAGYSFEPLPVAESQGQGESNPTGGQQAGSQGVTSGQGEPDPTATTGTATEPVSASSGTVDTTASASTEGNVSSDAKPSGPYSGKRYYDHPTYVPFSQWIDGGGSEEDYHWRPSVLVTGHN